MGRHALRLLRLLWRRRQSGTALSGATCHDATEQVAGSMANLGWLRLGRAMLAGAATGLQFALELCDPVIVSGTVSNETDSYVQLTTAGCEARMH